MRASGILMGISSIPSKYGIGCFSKEAYDFVDQLEKAGQQYWQILPLGPTGYGDSPYQSVSTFAGNPYFIDLEELIKKELLTKEECEACDWGGSESYVDYEKMYLSRYKLLRKAYEKADLKTNPDYAEFLKEEKDWLQDYCLFMAIKNEQKGICWIDWPEELKDRHSKAVKEAEKELAEEIEFYRFQQYCFTVTEKLVPIMALFYIIGCVIILVMNASAIPNAFVQIFTLAFQPQAIAGGVAGVTVQQAMRYGVARGLFSNEAGLGSTPHAHALAKVKQPQDQGALAIIGVFVDTFVILTLTALVLITSGLIPEGMTGTALTQAAFSLTFGSFGKVFIAICMLFFAFSTILGWYFFGQVNFNALFGSKYTKVYSLIVVLFILIGSSLKVDLVWALADFFNGLMAVPNLLALLALSGVVAGIARNKKD